MEEKIKKIISKYYILFTESGLRTKSAEDALLRQLKQLYIDNQGLQHTYENDNEHCGDIAKELGYPIGEVGCPHCGVGHMGKIHRICNWCEADMFSSNPKSVILIIEDLVKERPKEWRKGQAYFNFAHSMFPEEADKIRGTEADCFYDDTKIVQFKDTLFYLLTS